MPMMRTALPEVTVSPAVKPLVPAKTLIYQKDAAKPAAPPPAVTAPVVYQLPAAPATAPVPTLPSGALRTQPPGINDIGLQSDEDLKRTIIIEADKQYGQTDNIYKNFPKTYYDDEPRMKEAYVARTFAPSALRVEPTYVCYDRLYFEDKNSDRFGWEFGPLQPLVSAGNFYANLLSLPYHYGTRPCQRFETDAGYCLPGDPVPYLIYPVELSLTGGLLEAGTVVGLYAILP
jgi:hypothetical protein